MTCSIDKCDKPVKCKGLCSYHYHSQYYANNRKKINARHKAYPKEFRGDYMRNYCKTHRNEINAQHRKYLASRKKVQ